MISSGLLPLVALLVLAVLAAALRHMVRAAFGEGSFHSSSKGDGA